MGVDIDSFFSVQKGLDNLIVENPAWREDYVY